jgi:hypothetical protein
MLAGQATGETRMGAHYGKIINSMERTLPKVTYQGYRIGEGWEGVVKRPGQRLRLLDGPQRKGEWAINLLTDYLGDDRRAADLHYDFAALTLPRFTGDWELSERDVENTLMEVKILRARWRVALARG